MAEDGTPKLALDNLLRRHVKQAFVSSRAHYASSKGSRLDRIGKISEMCMFSHV
jgi:hypothetical protein